VYLARSVLFALILYLAGPIALAHAAHRIQSGSTAFTTGRITTI
jgi:hypothetical protein